MSLAHPRTRLPSLTPAPTPVGQLILIPPALVPCCARCPRRQVPTHRGRAHCRQGVGPERLPSPPGPRSKGGFSDMSLPVGTGGDAVPDASDLHHRMSKKIAQLTKVGLVGPGPGSLPGGVKDAGRSDGGDLKSQSRSRPLAFFSAARDGKPVWRLLPLISDHLPRTNARAHPLTAGRSSAT